MDLTMLQSIYAHASWANCRLFDTVAQLSQEQPAGAPAMAISHVIKINPGTLKVQEMIRYPFNDAFNFATGAIQVGQEIWVGSVRGDRIARFPIP